MKKNNKSLMIEKKTRVPFTAKEARKLYLALEMERKEAAEKKFKEDFERLESTICEIEEKIKSGLKDKRTKTRFGPFTEADLKVLERYFDFNGFNITSWYDKAVEMWILDITLDL